MRLHRLTHYLLEKRWQAIAITFLISFIPIVSSIGIIIAALMTLIKGTVEGAIFLVAATVPCLISFYFSGHYEASNILLVWTAVSVTILSNLLTWMFALFIYRKLSLSSILQLAALSGVLMISLIHLAYPNVSDWWGKELQQVQTMVDTISPKMPVSPQPVNQLATVKKDILASTINSNSKTSQEIAKNKQNSEVILFTKQYATGLMVAAILLNAFLLTLVARWWQCLIYSPGRLKRELHSIRLTQLAGISFAVSIIILFYWGNSVLLDIMPILYLLFTVAGLSLVHYLFGLAYSSHTWFWMLLFYIVIIISMPVSLFLLSMFALVDIWFDFRKRFKKL